jgi:hypothetical protein
MKTIQTPLVITSFRAKVDGSLGISGSTPELSIEEKVAFMELQSQQLMAFFEPEDDNKEVVEVKGKLEGKTPGQRLRSVIFVYWKQKGEIGDFEQFYKKQIEKLIDKVKENLDR